MCVQNGGIEERESLNRGRGEGRKEREREPNERRGSGERRET